MVITLKKITAQEFFNLLHEVKNKLWCGNFSQYQSEVIQNIFLNRDYKKNICRFKKNTGIPPA
jgi:hypothetical protein